MRRAWRWVLAVAAVLALIATTIWWWDLAGMVPAVQAIYPAIAVGALVVFLLAALARARPAGLIALVAVVVAAVAVVPTLQATGRPRAGEGGPVVSVLALNTQFGMADVGRLKEVVQDRRTDVLVLTEAGPQFVPYVRDALGQILPYDSGDTIGGAGGTIVLSRYPMTVLDRDDASGRGPTPADDDSDPQQPIVRLDVEGSRLVVRGVHPRSPTGSKTYEWRDDLADLARWQRDTDGPLIVAGDFNSGWVHPAFREVANGLDDALRETGQAWAPTWPVDARIPTFTQIDHVLSRGLTARAAGTVVVPGTDHKGVWAELTLPTS